MPSREWDHFMDNFFGNPYMMWHDGIDYTAAARLKGDEWVKAEDMLIESMENGSHYAAMGLREMKSKKAVSRLKDKLTNSGGRSDDIHCNSSQCNRKNSRIYP